MKRLFQQKMKTFGFLICQLFGLMVFSQDIDSLKISDLQEVVLQGTRAKGKNPITYTNVSKAEIAPRNLGQDIPILMNFLPSVVTTSDAGNGVGYTYMRVRGSDGSRINVTLNGVPFNDSESHGTFFVNLPDFASSLESVQLQRGVGTSTNGGGAFGASLNMQTKSYSLDQFFEVNSSFGSFGTQKQSFAFSTGLHNKLEFNARISKIDSDGFIDRASTNMFGYFLNANYVKEKTLIKFYAFGGKEKTYQAWNGQDESTLAILADSNPDMVFGNRFNVSGIKSDENGSIIGYHDNEIDNYRQHHFQLHWSQKWSDYWQSNVALHYTKGQGFFEQYVDNYHYTNVLFRDDSQLSFLGLPNLIIDGNTISRMDYIRRRWLDNNFYGATFSLNYQKDKTQVLLGGAVNRYLGLHYGEVIWNQYNIQNIPRYYNNFGNKDEVNVYAKVTQDLDTKWSLYSDLQYRMVFYEATSFRFDDVNDTFKFFNPKAGINYQHNENHQFFAYFGVANKEPRRDDYESGAIKPEQLQDIELGWRVIKPTWRLNTNLFYMNYFDQLVMTGALNDVGAPVYTNSGSSFRSGIEIDAIIKLNKSFSWQPNVTLSMNKNRDFNFQRDGVILNLGNTDIAYSPNVVAGSQLKFNGFKNFSVNFLSKYVGTQFMGNIDSDYSKLPAFFINDLNLTYLLKPAKSFFKEMIFSALINNIFDVNYTSNGYFYTYDDDFSVPNTITTIEGKGLYPQAGINFLAGVTLKF